MQEKPPEGQEKPERKRKQKGEYGACVATATLRREAYSFCGRARTYALISSLPLTTFVSGEALKR